MVANDGNGNDDYGTAGPEVTDTDGHKDGNRLWILYGVRSGIGEGWAVCMMGTSHIHGR